MIGKLLTLAIVLAVVYLVLTQVGPMINRFGSVSTDTESIAGDEGADCVDRAAAANDSLGRVARQYGQPPVNVEAWSDAQWGIESQIQTAASACYCLAEACEKASEALDEMRSLLSNLDGMVRGTSPGFANPAHQQERIFKLLNEARAAVDY